MNARNSPSGKGRRTNGTKVVGTVGAAATPRVVAAPWVAAGASLACALGFAPRAEAAPPGVVKDFDVERYLGRWYEIASTKPVFQAGCACTTADYAATPDAATIGVVNACVRADGSPSRVEGTATVADPAEPAKLRVSFGGLGDVFSRLLGPSNYWVVDRDEDYRWAVVSTRFRSPVWILAREPRLDPTTLAAIKERLARDGFDPKALKDTRQEGCAAP